ncbi:hypothetical protein [Methylobacterium ajmalii]|uniref:hypothetical protein n=1 Tax=Methylobacterium ajmalii TaxID=2738439 RepID=UPI002F35C50E
MTLTPRQVVDTVEEVARSIAASAGYSPDASFKFYQNVNLNSRAGHFWSAAVSVYEIIASYDANDALQQVLADEERGRSDPHAVRLRGFAGSGGDSWAFSGELRESIRKGADAIDELARIRREAKAYDDKMGDVANDGANAQSPDGDDYNELWRIIGVDA